MTDRNQRWTTAHATIRPWPSRARSSAARAGVSDLDAPGRVAGIDDDETRRLGSREPDVHRVARQPPFGFRLDGDVLRAVRAEDLDGLDVLAVAIDHNHFADAEAGKK